MLLELELLDVVPLLLVIELLELSISLLESAILPFVLFEGSFLEFSFPFEIQEHNVTNKVITPIIETIFFFILYILLLK